MKVFGYPTFDSNGEMILTTYENEYSHMKMDIRVYKLKAGERKKFGTDFEEVAVLLLKGKGCFLIEGKRYSISRKSVFLEGPYAAHIAKDNEIEVMAESEMEILVQKTKMIRDFLLKCIHLKILYGPIHLKGSSVMWRTVELILFLIMTKSLIVTWY